METGQQLTEEDERASGISTPRNLAVRAPAPSGSSRTFGRSTQSSIGYTQDGSHASSGEVWAGAISRVQTQVSHNTSMLDSHRQKVQDIEVAITKLDQAVGNAMAVLQDVRAEQRARPTVEPTRHDPEDLNVLAERVGAISSRVNEVDALRMQVRLLENRMKRWEEHGPPTAADTMRGPGPAMREPAYRESQVPSQYSGPSRPPSIPSQHHPLPPIRTSANMSPVDTRSTSHTLSALHRPSMDSSATMQASSMGSFRLGEPLPPPSALSGWHMGDNSVSSNTLPPPTQPGPSRQTFHHPQAQAAGWAAVNAPPTAKRPFEEPRQSPYQSSVPGSPKRPRLAPIMPRTTYIEESSYIPSNVPNSTADTHLSRSRAPSDSSQSQIPSQAHTLPTPASANMPGHRFIVSTQSADSQESWRPETERLMQMPHRGHGVGGGRRGGRGGRGRARGSRGGGRGGVSIVPAAGPELGTPEWERADWTGTQVSPNGYYRPLPHQPGSPQDTSRGGIVRRVGAAAAGPSERESELPATPLTTQGPYDPFAAGASDQGPGSGGKKSRSKPFRNAEGVLIRKDGRPDMRSVSSANNLRKVHAKKEAERAEMEGRTPTSARSLAPANSLSEEEDDEEDSGSPGSATQDREGGEPTDTQERHRELMSRIFPSSVEDASRSAGARFFPTHEQRDTTEAEMKREPRSEEQTGVGEGQEGASSQMTDVVMREMSEAQAENHQRRGEQEDTRMATVEEEASEEQEQEQGREEI
ncbi:uncharacterized protein LTR77_001216 [Saxophila tyrrhenica]|uniref:Uncharacterized protein n=1 Tax=Saxophila tyrrhenica TaxID=1690608 RepID=A0AAV9PK75_9PEZI|nr:hypothetical protein LTR77_001216 [Saxophila tyrrhenica]